MTRGLTMVELVVTIALAAILGIPTGRLLVEHVRLGMQTQDSMRATQLARYEVERLDSLNAFFTADLAVATTTINNYLSTPYRMTRVVGCLEGDCTTVGPVTAPGVKQITVTLIKPDTGATLARMTTYRTKNVSFGS